MEAITKIPRCVVTGNRAGKSAIISDEQVTNVSEHIPGLVLSDIWATNAMPVSLGNQAQVENTLFPNVPKNGSYFRYCCIPPDSELTKYFPELEDTNPASAHPFMHKTETLDYIIILSGELYLILEEGETLLKAGDIVIQRGTNHAWSNRSNEPCIQLAILLDAKQT